MLYRNFAIATLLGAPLLVMMVEAVVPKAPASPESVAVETADFVPQPVAPPVIAPQAPSVAPPANFGQPMPGAGQPTLIPGAGLPDAPAMIGTPAFSPLSAPPGSPNAE
ncbi:hypothetical protein [Sphingobium sp. MK2]|uniref:hypothetical protein n=1 Tax=Sphingobium sp. MK2 TaxID=3116540 RepID=UPI0032E35BDA